MMLDKNKTKILEYYLRSRKGYDKILWGSKHLGFYKNCDRRISEKEAQKYMLEVIGKTINPRKNYIILDAGCGQGIVALYLAKKYKCKVIGITIVPFEARKAEELSKKMKLENRVKFYVMDYSNTTFKDNYFDVIYTVESLVHSPNLLRTIKEFYRILKPGGLLILFEYSIADLKKFDKKEKEAIKIISEETSSPSLTKITLDFWFNTFKKTGFKVLEARDITPYVAWSFIRLRRLAFIPYLIARLFGLQRRFINLTIANELYKIGKKRLVRYNVFIAKKPR